MGLRYDLYDPNQSIVIHPNEVIKMRLEEPSPRANLPKCYAFCCMEGEFDNMRNLVEWMIMVHAYGDALVDHNIETFDGQKPGVLFEFYVSPEDRDAQEACRKALAELKLSLVAEGRFGTTVSISY